MELKQTIIRESAYYWHRKGEGKILVTDKAHIPIVIEALIAQDNYWEDMEQSFIDDLFEVIPNDGMWHGHSELRYYGKRDIYHPKMLVDELEAKGIPVFLVSEPQQYED